MRRIAGLSWVLLSTLLQGECHSFPFDMRSQVNCMPLWACFFLHRCLPSLPKFPSLWRENHQGTTAGLCWIASYHFARPQFWPLLQLSLNSIQLDFDPWSIFAYRPNGSLQQDVRPIQPSYRCCIDLGLGSWSSDAQQCSFRRPRQDAMSQHVPTCPNMSQHVPTCPNRGQKCHDNHDMPQVPHASCSPTLGAPRAQRLQLLRLRAPEPAPALQLPRPWAGPRWWPAAPRRTRQRPAARGTSSMPRKTSRSLAWPSWSPQCRSCCDICDMFVLSCPVSCESLPTESYWHCTVSKCAAVFGRYSMI